MIGPQAIDQRSLYRETEVAVRTGWASQVGNIVRLQSYRLGYIVIKKPETRMALQVSYVIFLAGNEVIQTYNRVLLEEPLT